MVIMKKFLDSYDVSWFQLQLLVSHSYKCPYCQQFVSSEHGYTFTVTKKNDTGNKITTNGDVCICPSCSSPTILIGSTQIPGIAEERSVSYLPDDINTIYEEARTCMSHNCFTSVAMLCRKIIMNVAVEKGAKEGDKFASYIDFLESEHYTPKDSKLWVDKIRTLGNGATHKIDIISQETAKTILKFTRVLLMIMYELPNEASIS